MFFEKHATTRKVIAYGPSTLLGGAYLMEQFTSCKLLPTYSLPFAAAIAITFFFSGLAESYERSLQNRKIERLK